MLELLHLVDKTFAFLADKMVGGNPHIVQKKFGRITAVPAYFVELPAHFKAGQIGRYHEQTEAVMPGRVVGSGQKRQKIGLGPISDISLAAIDDIFLDRKSVV